MTALAIVVPLFSLALAQTPADTSVVLEGRPTIKVESAEDLTTRSEVAEAEREKLKVVIVKKGGRYYWASRDNRELTRRVSGAFHYFVDAAEGGYVRVFDTSTLAESLRPEGPRFQYIEHIPLFRGTVTYWGGLDTFEE